MPDVMFRHDDFSPHLRTCFATTDDGAALDLTLSEVQPLHSHASDTTSRTPFSLLFTADAPPILMQGTYHLTHPAMGALDIFLVPVAGDDTSAAYEAVFN